MKLRVVLNGTKENRYMKLWGLTQNPFPQIPEYELHHAMMQLNSLDGDPLMGPEDIANRLEGWSPEFIKLCQKMFIAGEQVTFEVELP